MHLRTIFFSVAIISTVSASRFHCDVFPNCDCNSSFDLEDIQCPKHSEIQPDYVIKIKNKGDAVDAVLVQCLDSCTFWKEALLPSLNLGPIRFLKFNRCSFLPDGINKILNKFGITAVREFVFDHPSSCENITLTREHFTGLPMVQQFGLSRNVTKIQRGAFENLQNLAVLNLENNALELLGGDFQQLNKLKSLDLSRNKMTAVQRDLFTDTPELLRLFLWSNNLAQLDPATFQGLRKLALLDLMVNKLRTLPEEVFADLVSLKEINLSKNELQTLPEGLFRSNKKLERVRLEGNWGLALPKGLFSGLVNLTHVNLEHCMLKNIPEDTFQQALRLSEVILRNNLLGTIPETLFADTKNLVKIDLSSNRITSISGNTFFGLKRLRNLNLKDNSLEVFEEGLFGQLGALEELNANSNRLRTIRWDTFRNNSLLEELDLGKNALDLEEYRRAESPFDHLGKLKVLRMDHNLMEYFPGGWIQKGMRTFDLSNNNITSINFDFFAKLNTSTEVDLYLANNNIKVIDILPLENIVRSWKNLDARSFTKKTMRVFLNNNPLVCDCKAFGLVSYLYNDLDPNVMTLVDIQPGTLTCSSPDNFVSRRLVDLHPYEMTCAVEEGFCPKNCSCEVRPWDATFLVDCYRRNLDRPPKIDWNPLMEVYNRTEVYLDENNLTSAPTEDFGYANVTRLFLQKNQIREVAWVPPNVEMLFLHENNLSLIGASVLGNLNESTSLRNLSLHGNPWICDCRTANLTNFLLHQLLMKHLGPQNITCVQDGKLLINLKVDDLCPAQTIYILILGIISGVLFVLVATTTALYYKYQLPIKVWSWHFLGPYLGDQTKQYDVFISYAPEDEDFVLKNLIPTLEQPPNPYKVCLPDRDWTGGQFIAENIAKSIDQSKRTLVVMSENFLKSFWNRMEFRTAHANALTDRQARVILIIYEELNTNGNDDKDLQAYLKTNTYIKWDDPYFWSRLKYALPGVRSTTSNKLNNIMIKIDKLQLDVPSSPNNETTPPISSLGSPLMLKKSPLEFRGAPTA